MNHSGAWVAEVALIGGVGLIGLFIGTRVGRRLGVLRLLRFQQRRSARWLPPGAPVADDGSMEALLAAFEDAVVAAAHFDARSGYAVDNERSRVETAANLHACSAGLRERVYAEMGGDPQQIRAFVAQTARPA